jgi:hypothetical protein
MESESELDRIQSFVEIGNYHAAINLAISGLNECRRNDDQAGVDRFLGIIKGIVQVMEDEFGTS